MRTSLSTRSVQLLLAATLLASLIGLLALGPVGLDITLRRATDLRTVLGVPNGWSVWLQLPLLAVTLMGCVRMHQLRRTLATGAAWTLFFALASVACLGSIVDHLEPSATGYVLSKLPSASAATVLSLIFLAERMGYSLVAPRVMRWALCSGPIGGLVHAGAWLMMGRADLRWLVFLECLPMLLIPLGIWNLRSEGLTGPDWLVALLWFAAAKLLDGLSLALWQGTAHTITGHALHHLPLAICLGWLAWRASAQVCTRSELTDASEPFSNQRSTSLNTAG